METGVEVDSQVETQNLVISVKSLKVLAALSSFVLAVVGCWVARRLERAKSRGPMMVQILVGGNMLASGILLAAALTHMLPDAIEALKDVTTFPLAPTIAGTAFCFLVILGEVVTSYMPSREEPHTHTACITYEASFAIWPRWELMPPHGCEDPRVLTYSDPKAEGAEKPAACSPMPSETSSVGFDATTPTCHPSAQAVADKGHSCHSHSSCCRIHRHSDAPCSTTELPQAGSLRQPLLATQAEPPSTRPSEASPGTTGRQSGGGHSHGHDIEGLVSRCHVRGVGGGPMAEVKSYLLFSALCFHSVMEGLGLGSSRNGGLLLPIILAILAHKGLAAFALGSSLCKSDLEDWKFWVFVIIFSAGTPFGCLLGAIFLELGTASQSVASGICIALASGTFLQVSSMELLPRVLAEEGHKILGGFLLWTGFALMSLLAIWC